MTISTAAEEARVEGKRAGAEREERGRDHADKQRGAFLRRVIGGEDGQPGLRQRRAPHDDQRACARREESDREQRPGRDGQESRGHGRKRRGPGDARVALADGRDTDGDPQKQKAGAGPAARERGKQPLQGRPLQLRMKASRSALIWSLWVEHMPCGSPG